jgi:hypothetical protein
MLEQADTTTSSTVDRSRFSPYRQSPPEMDVSSLRFEATPLSPTLQAGFRRLATLGALPANWDTYGSPPPQRLATLLARSALAFVAALDAPLPSIGPISGGGLHLAWEGRGRCLDLNMFPDGSCEFLASVDDEERDGTLEAGDTASIRKLLGWFLRT